MGYVPWLVAVPRHSSKLKPLPDGIRCGGGSETSSVHGCACRADRRDDQAMVAGARRPKKQPDKAQRRDQTKHERPHKRSTANRAALPHRKERAAKNGPPTAARANGSLYDVLDRIRGLAPECIWVEIGAAFRVGGAARLGCPRADGDQILWGSKPVSTDPHNIRRVLPTFLLFVRSD